MDDFNNPYARREPAIDPSNPFASPLAEENPALNRGRKLNPWFSAWTQPRATIRQIVATDPRRHVLVLAALAGACQTPDQDIPDPEIMGRVIYVVTDMLVGAVLGIVGVHVLSWLAKVVAGWMGGTGTLLDTRAAVAWSAVPYIWMLPLILVMNAWWVVSAPAIMPGDIPAWYWVVIVLLIPILIIVVWQIVVMSLMIAEVQKIHGGLGCAALFIAGTVAFIILLAVAIPLVMLIGH